MALVKGQMSFGAAARVWGEPLHGFKPRHHRRSGEAGARLFFSVCPVGGVLAAIQPNGIFARYRGDVVA